MGKNLHYTILPFIENALNNHHIVDKIESIKHDDYYIYKVYRKNNMSSVIVVLSDDYYFGPSALYSKPKILKDGGFFLVARPEATIGENNIPNEKLGIGSIRKLMVALNKEDFWNYEPEKYKNTKN